MENEEYNFNSLSSILKRTEEINESNESYVINEYFYNNTIINYD